MSPLSRRQVHPGGELGASPFIGPVDHTEQTRIDVSTLTANEVNADGYLIAGTPIQLRNSPGAAPVPGALVTAVDQAAGVVFEDTKVAADNAAATLAAAPDVDAPVAYMCQINQDRVEDMLGRALTAAELAALRTGNVHVVT